MKSALRTISYNSELIFMCVVIATPILGAIALGLGFGGKL